MDSQQAKDILTEYLQVGIDRIRGAQFQHGATVTLSSRDDLARRAGQLHGLLYVVVAEHPADRDMRLCSTSILNNIRGPIQEQGLRLFLAGSYFDIIGAPEFLKPLSPILLEKFVIRQDKEDHVDMQRAGFKEYVKPLIELGEKYGMLRFHIDSIPSPKLDYCVQFARIHFYDFVFVSKALLDQFAVVLNDLLGIGEEAPRNIDLVKGKFRERVKEKWPHARQLFDRLARERWFDELKEYRDALIHKRGLTMARDFPGMKAIWVSKNPSFDVLMEGTEGQIQEMKANPLKYLRPVDEVTTKWFANTEALLQALSELIRVKLSREG